MGKIYSAPDLVAYGDVAKITRAWGINGADDMFFDPSGNDVSDSEDAGSHDVCVIADQCSYGND